MTTQIPAIVFAHGLNGLGAVRSLGIAGIPVIAIGLSKRDPALRSRYASERVVMSRDVPQEERFRTALKPFADRGYPIIATSDPAANFLCSNADELAASFAIATPPQAAMAAFLDKQQEYELLSSAKVPMPLTATRLKVGGVPLEMHPGLPLIIKPRTLEDSQHFEFKNLVVREKSGLNDALKRIGDHIERCIAQRIIEGPDEALWVCNATFGRNHEMLCGMTFQRMGLSPPHFGVTTLAVSRENAEVRAHAERLGKLYEWVGPCMFEFKWDATTGNFVYIETNPRLGMCNWFDTRTGVNNVLATYLLSLGRESEIQNQPQQDGKYFVSLFADAMARLEDEERLSSIMARYVQLLRERRIGAWWYWLDPLPGLLHVAQQLRRVASYPIRRFKRRAESSAIGT